MTDLAFMFAASALSLIASMLLTRKLRHFAAATALLDHPTARSSHHVPTPRGGGLAIVLCVLATVLVTLGDGRLAPHTGVAVAGGGLITALSGWLDDRQGLSPRVRAALHLVAAAWAVGWLGGLPDLRWGDRVIHFGLWGHAIAVIGIVWAINLFNFMDGIDGLAAMEAATVSGFGAILLYLSGQPGLGVVSAGVLAAALGFLRFNWPPAAIFMGDVGSSFLGFVFAALALASERAGGPPLLLWSLLAALFIVDATLTLLRRWSAGARVTQAHRSHAYQRLTQWGWSHGRVTATALGLNLGLAALAMMAWAGVLRSWTAWALGMFVVVVGYVAVERVKPMTREGP